MDADAINLGLLILRVTVGFVIFAHGWNHLKAVRRGPGIANWFEGLGVKPGLLHSWTVTITEIVGGIALAAGLFTPFAAGGVCALMVVAYMTNHRNVGFFITKRPTEGYEYVLTLALVSIAMGALGPGQWSLDDALDIVVDGWEGFAVAAGIGLLGGAAFLAMFWRPPKPEEAAAA